MRLVNGDRLPRKVDFPADLFRPDSDFVWCEMCESEVLRGSAHTCRDAKAARAQREDSP